MRKFWISWKHPKDHGPFTLDFPWWVTGHTYTGNGEVKYAIFCAAVMAATPDKAKNVIYDAYDKTPNLIGFRFCQFRPDDWVPFTENYPREPWMVWPGEPLEKETNLPEDQK